MGAVPGGRGLLHRSRCWLHSGQHRLVQAHFRGAGACALWHWMQPAARSHLGSNAGSCDAGARYAGRSARHAAGVFSGAHQHCRTRTHRVLPVRCSAGARPAPHCAVCPPHSIRHAVRSPLLHHHASRMQAHCMQDVISRMHALCMQEVIDRRSGDAVRGEVLSWLQAAMTLSNVMSPAILGTLAALSPADCRFCFLACAASCMLGAVLLSAFSSIQQHHAELRWA
jgi:hypothetical protein